MKLLVYIPFLDMLFQAANRFGGVARAWGRVRYEKLGYSLDGAGYCQAPHPVRAVRCLDDLVVLEGEGVSFKVASTILIPCASDHCQGLAVGFPETSMRSEWVFLKDGRRERVHLDEW